jgi:hypothetical protein
VSEHQPEPPAITEAELAGALRDLNITAGSATAFYPDVAEAIFGHIRRHREPAGEDQAPARDDRCSCGVKLRQSLTTRAGRKVPRMLYRQLGDEPADDDPIIGLVDTPELAALIVAAVNAYSRDDGEEAQ